MGTGNKAMSGLRSFGGAWPARLVPGMLGVGVGLLLLAGGAFASGGKPLQYAGQVLYKGAKIPAPGLLVELVEAEDDGKPSDEVLGSARADAAGRFVVVLEKPTDEKVTLVVSAVRSSAESGGDRRGEGYEIQHHRTILGYLPFPSTTKPNTLYIERRKVGRPAKDE